MTKIVKKKVQIKKKNINDIVISKKPNTKNPSKTNKFKDKIPKFDKLKNIDIEVDKFRLIMSICAFLFVCMSFFFAYKYFTRNDEPVRVEVYNMEEQKPKEKTEIEKVAEKTEEKVKEEVKEESIPYTNTYESLGGGYTMVITTYNPSDPNKMYIDFSINKPENKIPSLDDDKAKEIITKASKDLPKIGSTITVKDKEKVSFEVYKEQDKYNTILLYDGEPFGYLSIDENDEFVSHVTNYYVKNIAVE